MISRADSQTPPAYLSGSTRYQIIKSQTLQRLENRWKTFKRKTYVICVCVVDGHPDTSSNHSSGVFVHLWRKFMWKFEWHAKTTNMCRYLACCSGFSLHTCIYHFLTFYTYLLCWRKWNGEWKYTARKKNISDKYIYIYLAAMGLTSGCT